MRIRSARFLLLAALAVVVPAVLAAAPITLPNTFSNGTIADAAQVNANFSTLANAVNALDASLDSYAMLYDDAGAGSTNTLVRRYTSASSNGTDLSLNRSTTLGDSITVNSTGLYEVSFNARYTTTGVTSAITRDSTVFEAIPHPAGKALLHYDTANATGLHTSGSRTVYLAAGTVVRLVTYTGVVAQNTGPQHLTVRRVR